MYLCNYWLSYSWIRLRDARGGRRDKEEKRLGFDRKWHFSSWQISDWAWYDQTKKNLLKQEKNAKRHLKKSIHRLFTVGCRCAVWMAKRFFFSKQTHMPINGEENYVIKLDLSRRTQTNRLHTYAHCEFYGVYSTAAQTILHSWMDMVMVDSAAATTATAMNKNVYSCWHV